MYLLIPVDPSFFYTMNFYKWLYVVFMSVLVISNITVEPSVMLGLLAILCVVCV